MLRPAHIAGVSKTAYAPATPCGLDWPRDPRRTSTDLDLPDAGPQAARRRAARRRRGARRSARPPAAGVLGDAALVADPVALLDGVLDGRPGDGRPAQRPAW